MINQPQEKTMQTHEEFFPAMRKCRRTSKQAKVLNELLSLSIHKSGTKNGIQSHCVVFHMAARLLSEMGYKPGDGIEIEFNKEKTRAKMKISATGNKVLMNKTKSFGIYRRLSLHEFDHLPIDTRSLIIEIIDRLPDGSVIFEIPFPPAYLF